MARKYNALGEKQKHKVNIKFTLTKTNIKNNPIKC